MVCIEKLNFNAPVPEKSAPAGASPAVVEQSPLPVQLLPSERNFYGSYPWSLNIHLTVEDAVLHLREELKKVDKAKESWQLFEILTNVFLLSCAITNELDDYLIGKRYDFSKLTSVPLGTPAVRAANKFQEQTRKIREWRLKPLQQWREQWQAVVDRYLEVFVSASSSSPAALSACSDWFESVLEFELPKALKARRLKNPAFFHSRDLTPFDVLKLGEKFVGAFPDRGRPILLVGLRTAGSYFAPLVRAYLQAHGYDRVKVVTIRPRSVLGCLEKAQLARGAQEGRTAVIIDESPIGGGSTAGVIKALTKMGHQEDRIVALMPIHRLYRDWKNGWDNLKIAKAHAVTLEPEEWRRQTALAPERTETLLEEYFRVRGYLSIKVIESAMAEHFNSYLRSSSDEKYHSRCKRIYEVQLQTADGNVETRYVLAKSVGWGWLSYHAFLLSEGLSRFVPPVLGLRNGFLYSEWRPQADNNAGAKLNEQLTNIASYVAVRARAMALNNDPTPDLLRERQHRGCQELMSTLSRAYGSRMARFLRRPRMQRSLALRVCPIPTVIDGKMRREEWIAGPSSLLKTDFEHHGLGKGELEITDPAYDLAETILHFKLSGGEEHDLVSKYIEQSGDKTVGERLFLNKLLAGNVAMDQALANIRDARLSHRIQEWNQRYLDAYSFLMVQTMRMCASFCSLPKTLAWRTPLVVLDIDGVLDTPVFGFPSTTAAGIRAISLLHSHELVAALNTARCVSEVKEYCRAYGFAGGVAEYGSAIWDAVTQEERVLVSGEALLQVHRLKDALRKLPGIFLNEAYQYSVRTYTYSKEQTSPLPTLLIQNLMANLNLDQLRIHQTGLDTAVIAKDVDKGTGLVELMKGIAEKDPEIIAIGDSDPDLAMFRVAKRSFAPSHIWCRSDAEKLGCHIARYPYQPGLLDAVRSLLHPNGKRCQHCRRCDTLSTDSNDLVLQLLEASDQKRIPTLIKAVLDPLALKAFS